MVEQSYPNGPEQSLQAKLFAMQNNPVVPHQPISFKQLVRHVALGTGIGLAVPAIFYTSMGLHAQSESSAGNSSEGSADISCGSIAANDITTRKNELIQIAMGDANFGIGQSPAEAVQSAATESNLPLMSGVDTAEQDITRASTSAAVLAIANKTLGQVGVTVQILPTTQTLDGEKATAINPSEFTTDAARELGKDILDHYAALPTSFTKNVKIQKLVVIDSLTDTSGRDWGGLVSSGDPSTAILTASEITNSPEADGISHESAHGNMDQSSSDGSANPPCEFTAQNPSTFTYVGDKFEVFANDHTADGLAFSETALTAYSLDSAAEDWAEAESITTTPQEAINALKRIREDDTWPGMTEAGVLNKMGNDPRIGKMAVNLVYINNQTPGAADFFLQMYRFYNGRTQ